MTWEEIIVKIRQDPNYSDLVEKAYFDADLALNVKRFSASEEFEATLELLKKYKQASGGVKLIDIGAGNGIASAAFAKLGYEVTAVEPDKSDTVGSGAIRKLKTELGLSNLQVLDSFGEQLPLETESFDVVYIRQAMHHAADLRKFIAEASRILKKGGLLLTVRDHVVFNTEDKEWFLNEHPLHKFYGGENAFTEEEYRGAMENAGIEIVLMLRHFDSVINFFPVSSAEMSMRNEQYEQRLKQSLRSRLGPFSGIAPVLGLYRKVTEMRNGKPFDEKEVPGRMYTFVGRKRP